MMMTALNTMTIAMMMTMIFALEQALGLSAMYPIQCKIIGDINDDIDGDDSDNDKNDNNNDDNGNEGDVGIGIGVRAYGNAPNSMQNNW